MKWKVLLPILTLVIAVMGALTLIATRPRLQPTQPEPIPVAVRVIEVQPKTVRMRVHSQGTVVPRTETELVPEVSGTVVWISPSLVAGGYFAESEELLKIDDRDYRASVARARAAVDRATADDEHARFELDRARQLDARELLSQSAVESALRAARVAEASLADARVALQQAERDLARTVVRAPFPGLVRSEQIDIGQFVSRGASIAKLYASDYLEVKLPIADQQLAYLKLPISRRGEIAESEAPDVLLSAVFAGVATSWPGRIVRTEAEIDRSSRMINAIARIRPGTEGESLPPVGLFVEAEIEGLAANNVVVLPRSAIRDNNQVLVVDNDNRMHFRSVHVLRLYKDEVYLDAGLKAGELVCVSPLQTVVNGMRVEPIRPEPEIIAVPAS